MSSNIKIAAVHDISGMGRCSLTVILPIVSAMGIQVCPVPTAALSTHTGYGDFVMRDLTDFIIPALEHYKSLGTTFDCVYSGFLASVEQISHCLEFFDSFPNALKVCDPVMGDGGKTYKTCTKELCSGMSKLASAADMITPNLTEAAILLGESYPAMPFRSSQAKSWLARLSEKGPGTVVMTSVPFSDDKIYNIGYDRENSVFWKIPCEYIPEKYPGSGDIFSSVLVGGILKGDSLPIAIARATSFSELSIKTTYSYRTDVREGVRFEPCLPWLSDHRIFANFGPL